MMSEVFVDLSKKIVNKQFEIIEYLHDWLGGHINNGGY